MSVELAEVVLHSERGRLGSRGYPAPGTLDPHRVDVTVFGSLQVSACGDLAQDVTPGHDVVPPRDLEHESHRVVVMMEHVDWRGRPRIVTRCTLPVARRSCVDRIITDLAVIEFEQNSGGARSLVLRDLAPGVSIARVVEATGAPLRIPPELIRPGSTL